MIQYQGPLGWQGVVGACPHGDTLYLPAPSVAPVRVAKSLACPHDPGQVTDDPVRSTRDNLAATRRETCVAATPGSMLNPAHPCPRLMPMRGQTLMLVLELHGTFAPRLCSQGQCHWYRGHEGRRGDQGLGPLGVRVSRVWSARTDGPAHPPVQLHLVRPLHLPWYCSQHDGRRRAVHFSHVTTLKH